MAQKKTSKLHKDSIFEFDARLERSRKMGSWTFLVFPYDAKKIFETTGLIRVLGTINKIPFNLCLHPSEGKHLIIVSQRLRREAKIIDHELVHVVLRRDPEPKKLTYPEELKAAFEIAPEFEKAFLALGLGRQRSYIFWIDSGKQEQTRANRVGEIWKRYETGDKRFGNPVKKKVE